MCELRSLGESDEGVVGCQQNIHRNKLIVIQFGGALKSFYGPESVLNGQTKDMNRNGRIIGKIIG